MAEEEKRAVAPAAPPSPVSSEHESENGSRTREGRGRGTHGVKKKVIQSPLLEKVPEGASPLGSDRSLGAGFGVRSYLHHFYEHGFRDPEIYEEDGDNRYLLQPLQRRRFRCAARWWKTFLCVGVIMLVVGLVSILVGYLSPPRDPVIGHQGNYEIIDRHAVVYNYNLEIAKVAGLVTFCCGGVALTLSLLFPSFFHQCCDSGEGSAEDSFMSSLQDGRRGSTSEGLPIPVNSSYDAIQPGNTSDLKTETK